MAFSYIGLKDEEVLRSRELHGKNILSQQGTVTFFEKIIRCFRYSFLRFAVFLFIVVSSLYSVFAIFNIVSLPFWGWVIIPLSAFFFIFTLLITFFGGKWNSSQNKMEVSNIITILLLATSFSIGISYYEFVFTDTGVDTFYDSIGIVIAILLATVVGYILERRNEKTFKSLNTINDDLPVKVIRNGIVREVCRWEVVVGDIMIVETGDEIAADAKLKESLHLVVNESSLTGELQCNKFSDAAHFDADATYPSNHILKGCTVIEGYGVGEVFAVGDATASGKVFKVAQIKEDDPTPLDKQLDHLASIISKVSYIIAALIIVIRVSLFLMNSGSSFSFVPFLEYTLETMMIAVALIVVSVPEGLPMAVTLSLAYNMKRLMKEHTLPRTMHSCETMGAVSVICTDKTGTLTCNQMRVYQTDFSNLPKQQLDGSDTAAVIIESIALNTTANIDSTDTQHIKVVGNPTEGALLLWLLENNIDYQKIRSQHTIVDRIPFTTENKYMATVVTSASGKKKLYVKGAPEIIMSFAQLSLHEKEKYSSLLCGFQQKAMRTLAFAYKEIEDSEDRFIFGGKIVANDLIMVGVVAIADPVRKEVPQAIKECLDAGIDIKIVTGDTPGTAGEIAKQIGLLSEPKDENTILLGQDIEKCNDAQLQTVLQGVKIVARARPNDKERIVRALKTTGQVVAVTGDGTNDAPALNVANVGLSMGDGTAVAKEASDITIMDNSFSTITNAVMWGRSLYKNIKRFVLFQLIVNIIACCVVGISAFLNISNPLTVTQMLWVNLIMDTFAALAFASLPPNKKVMREKPRPITESILKNIAGPICILGFAFTFLLFAILFFFYHYDIRSLVDFSASELHNKVLTQYELGLFFTIFVMMQFWNMLNVKAFMTGNESAFRHLTWKRCKEFLVILLIILIGQIAIVQVPFLQQMFNISKGGIKFIDWCVILLLTSFVLWIGELVRGIIMQISHHEKN